MLQAMHTRLFFLSLLFIACGPTSGGGPDDGGDNSSGDADNSCVDATSCTLDQICDPATDTCTSSKPCTDAIECGSGGTCNTDGDCEPSETGTLCLDDVVCRRGEACIGGYCGCEGEEFTPESIPPNMLILFDRSGSMGFGPGSKLDEARVAINAMVTKYPTNRYGFSPYSGDGNCGDGLLEVAIADNSASQIVAATNSVFMAGGSGGTPIGGTLIAHLNEPGLMDPSRENYILLITDGAESCLGIPEDGAAAHFAQGTKTFVVSFGAGVDAAQLNRIAAAGGAALPGATKYYRADNAAELNMALDVIGGAALGCDFILNADEAAKIVVHFDDLGIAEDPVDGWTYDPLTMTLTFSGAACDQLQTGAVDDLSVVNSCPIRTD